MRQLNEQKFCGWCGSTVDYFSEWASKCSGCGYKNYFNPKPCSNLIVAKDNKILMLRRAIDPQKGKLDMPGGYMDIPDESMEEAAYRELLEETGIQKDAVSPAQYLGSIKSPPYEWQDSVINTVSFYYLFKLKDAEIVIAPDQTENSEVFWIAREDLPAIDLAWDIDRVMLEKYFKENT